jgi:multiple sugar transport system permease protein
MSRSLGRLLFGLGIGLLVIWSLGPVYWAVNASFLQPDDMFREPPVFLATEPTLRHYANLLGGTSDFLGLATQSVWPLFRAAIVNSILTSAFATIATVVVAAFAGYAFARLDFRGRDLAFWLIILTITVPGYTVMIPLYSAFVRIGLIDTYLCITLIYISYFLPIALWLMRGTFRSVPISVEEAAWLDGAGRTYALFRVVLPMAAPGLIAAAILTFLNAWGQFLIPLVFAPTLDTKPVTVLIPEFVTKNYVDYGLMNAAGVLAILPPVLIVSFLSKYLVDGLSSGAGK